MSVAVRVLEPWPPMTRVFQVLPPPRSHMSWASPEAFLTMNFTAPAFGLAEKRIE